MFKKLIDKTQKGFTIIEVMIVLAIAGLILVVVLIAVPQLQANQRDSNKQNVAARLSTELSTYSGNNNGKYPFTSTDLADFNARYITGIVDLTNPKTGNEYTVAVAADSTAVTAGPTEDQLLIAPGYKCDGETPTGTFAATSRQYAIVVQLERTGVYYCVDNN